MPGPMLLGLLPPADTRHLEKYGLTADTFPTTPTPVVQGFSWREGFYADQLLQQDGGWWFPRPDRWGREVGGHATCLRPAGVLDHKRWRAYYNQTRQSCVAHASCRAMSLLNRETYDPEPLYDWCLRNDEFPNDETDTGTTVRAGMEGLRTVGPWTRNGKQDPSDGIAAYRWAGSVEEIARCLSPADAGATILNRGWVVMLNSWGPTYPYARIALEYLDILIFREGWRDASVIVDR